MAKRREAKGGFRTDPERLRLADDLAKAVMQPGTPAEVVRHAREVGKLARDLEKLQAAVADARDRAASLYAKIEAADEALDAEVRKLGRAIVGMDIAPGTGLHREVFPKGTSVITDAYFPDEVRAVVDLARRAKRTAALRAGATRLEKGAKVLGSAYETYRVALDRLGTLRRERDEAAVRVDKALAVARRWAEALFLERDEPERIYDYFPRHAGARAGVGGGNAAKPAEATSAGTTTPAPANGGGATASPTTPTIRQN